MDSTIGVVLVLGLLGSIVGIAAHAVVATVLLSGKRVWAKRNAGLRPHVDEET